MYFKYKYILLGHLYAACHPNVLIIYLNMGNMQEFGQNVPQFDDFYKCSSGSRILRSQFFQGLWAGCYFPRRRTGIPRRKYGESDRKFDQYFMHECFIFKQRSNEEIEEGKNKIPVAGGKFPITWLKFLSQGENFVHRKEMTRQLLLQEVNSCDRK